MIGVIDVSDRTQEFFAAVESFALDDEKQPLGAFVEDDPSTWGNPGRNDQCPCGSGKKFKHCHGRLA